MGEAKNIYFTCLKFKSIKKRIQNGSRSPEAHEARGGAHSLDAGQVGRMLRSPSFLRSPQVARVSPSGALLEESSQVRLDLHRSQEDPRPASRQGGRSRPHRPHLPSRLHGRHRDGEERRELSPHLRRQRQIQGSPYQQGRGCLQALHCQEGVSRPKGIPYLTTSDGRTIRYPDPLIKAQDCVKVDIATGKITDFIKFESGNVCMVTGGRNLGRVGIIMHREKHPGSFDIVHVKDAAGHSFATRLNYIFTIGKGAKPWVSLPEGKGIRMTVAEERDKRLAAKS